MSSGSLGNTHEAPRKAEAAVSEEQDGAVSSKGRVFMVLLALQYGCQPLLQKACITTDDIDRISLILVTEGTKMLLCVGAILSSGPKVYRPMLESWTFSASLQAAALPAAGYAVQNWLAQSAYAHLDSLTFNLLNQTKTLFAAFCLYLVMGKRQSAVQLFALSLLLGAALLLNSSVDDDGDEGKDIHSPFGSKDEESRRLERLWLGILPVFGASFLSGLCGAVTQRTLQTGYSSFQLSLELAVYGVLSLFASILFGGSSLGVERGSGTFGKGLFRGWTALTCVPVLSQALGGLFVGQVTKHAGSVQKGFSLIAGIFITATVQNTLEKSALTRVHWAAAVLVATGMYLHTNFPYRSQAEHTKNA